MPQRVKHRYDVYDKNTKIKTLPVSGRVSWKSPFPNGEKRKQFTSAQESSLHDAGDDHLQMLS